MCFSCVTRSCLFLLFTGILTDKKPTGEKFFFCFGAGRVDTGLHPLVSIRFLILFVAGAHPEMKGRATASPLMLHRPIQRAGDRRAPPSNHPNIAAVRIAVCVRRAVPVASGPMARSGLGKGLGALIGTPTVATPRDGSGAAERVHQIELTSIVPSTLQPRKDFARDVLLELIESIRQHGIIQPLIVRQVGTRFELIAGERRWRAAQELGLATVPAIVRTANDLEVLELSLIENLQRADLNPIEEAQGYARLANEFGMRQEDIALKVGRSRAAVANALRLLDLHPQVQIWLAQNLVSVGHAKVLLALKAPEEQLLAAETVLRRNATVRSTERMVARLLGIGRGRRKPRRAAGDSSATATAVEDLQNRLQQHLATHVTIHHGEKRGRIEIEYYGADDLQRIINALGLPDTE